MIILTRSMVDINVVLIADEYFKQIEILTEKNPINDYHLST